MSTLTKHNADLNNITIFSQFNEETYLTHHHIVCEWSLSSVESFQSYEDAQDFINGFKGLDTDKTSAYISGTIYRHCVETDIQDGIVYEKVLDINNMYNSEAV